MAGEGVDDEELEFGMAFELLQKSPSSFVNCSFSRVDQESHILHVEATECILDHVYVFVDLCQIGDTLLDEAGVLGQLPASVI